MNNLSELMQERLDTWRKKTLATSSTEKQETKRTTYQEQEYQEFLQEQDMNKKRRR